MLVAVLLTIAPCSNAQCVRPGVSRWAVKTSLPRKRNKPIRMTLEDMTALPAPAMAEADKERSTRFPDALGNGLREGSLVRVSGWIRLIATDPDCDYHIQLTSINSGVEGTVTVEVPSPESNYELWRAARQCESSSRISKDPNLERQ
jgi:hypothetical protein